MSGSWGAQGTRGQRDHAQGESVRATCWTTEHYSQWKGRRPSLSIGAERGGAGDGDGHAWASFLGVSGGSHFFFSIYLSRKPVSQAGAAVSNASCVSKVLTNAGPAGKNGSSFPPIPYPAGSKDISAADRLPNGPRESLR